MKRLAWTLGVPLLLLGLQWALSALLLDGPIRQGPYYYQILILAGINIVLAVSLNLTNGITGQFSIGHAGFFAVGAYVSASVSYYAGPAFRSVLAFLPPQLIAHRGVSTPPRGPQVLHEVHEILR